MLNFWKSFFSFKKNSSLKRLPEEYIKILGFAPHNEDFFLESLTPRALKKYKPNGEILNYERLEFLGDAILGSIVAEYLYTSAPKNDEGYLTKMRSKIVSRKHLNEIGGRLKLLDFIPYEHNIHLSHNILGDLFEAMIGAIYVDQNYEVTKNFVHRILIEPYINLYELEKKIISYKSLMIEWSQKKKKKLLLNTQEEENAEKKVVFVSQLWIEDRFVAKGRGYSKKNAEEIAAKRAYYKFNNKM